MMHPLRLAGRAIAARAQAFAGSEDRAAALLVISGFLLTVTALLLSRFIALEVMAKTTQQFDEDVLRWVHGAKQGLGDRQRLVDQFFVDVSALGGTTVLTFFTSFTIVYLALAGRRAEAALTGVVAVGGFLLNAFLKDYFGRPRPAVFPAPVVLSASFPSGHAMMSMTIYLTTGVLLARLAPTWTARIFATGAAVAVAILVASSRLYLGVHYPTDVTAGALIGLAWALTVLCADEVFRRKRREDRGET